MYHIRTPDSHGMHPISWCGAEPERVVLGPWLTGTGVDVVWGTNEIGMDVIIERKPYDAFCCTAPMMTEWDWVKANPHIPSICPECVKRILKVQESPTAVDDSVSPF